MNKKAGTSPASPADKEGDKRAAQRRRSQEEAAIKEDEKRSEIYDILVSELIRKAMQ